MSSPLPSLDALPTPAILVDRSRLAANIRSMQAAADAAGIELRPHIKTHKMVGIARQQLAAGAAGLTCAKLGEAEAMLPSGVRSLFLAHSLVSPLQAPRLAALAERLDDLRVAVTSEAHVEPLARLAALTGKKISVMMAVDTGLAREGVRDGSAASRLAAQVARSPHLALRGFFTHEGQFYGVAPADRPAKLVETIERLSAVRDAIDPALPIWPGSSSTARAILAMGDRRVQAVRPGTYVFGDLSLCRTTAVMRDDEVALHILATVVDKPERGLALIDAGSKVFSSDRTPDTIFGRAADGRDLAVVRVNEEHGYLRGSAVDTVQIGERIAFIPAHVCTVVNLTDEVTVVDRGAVVDTWRVDARGCVR
ncbi:MAG: alanine racemase [Opitutus sp.]|nr:alanine racemase [Opitutus sp.]